MYLFKVWQDHNIAYDTYDSFVCAAPTADEARKMHPSGETVERNADYGWASVEHVMVELLGKALEGTEAGVIVASYNAG